MPSDNGKGSGHTGRVRELARYIADQPDEITETNIDVQPGATLIVDQSGKHKALKADQTDVITKTDHGRPPMPSGEAIEKSANFLVKVVGAVDTWPKLWGLLGLLALAAFGAWLRWGH
jgi:hypothetical protein